MGRFPRLVFTTTGFPRLEIKKIDVMAASKMTNEMKKDFLDIALFFWGICRPDKDFYLFLFTAGIARRMPLLTSQPPFIHLKFDPFGDKPLQVSFFGRAQDVQFGMTGR